MELIDIALWWIALEAIGFFALPIALYIGNDLKDHGYSISKPLGLLLLTYISWLLGVFGFRYSSFQVLCSSGIIAACSLIILKKYLLHSGKYKEPQMNADKRRFVQYAVKFEILFLFAFVVFAAIRAYSPDIYWTGGEKFMDMTFINSLLRNTGFPPSDPWMSGSVMQYYYFGYLIVADLIKITGILPSIAFNLATASFFALSLTTAFGIGYNLTGRMRYGMITAFFVAIAGNLVGFFQLMDIITKGDVINNIAAFNYWTSSRVIPDTINEFPFFSFLQGDVHAHMISIAFQLLIILLLLNIIKSRNMISIFILGASIGFLYPLNTWDYPVYLVLAIFVMVFFLRSSKKNLLKLIFSTATLSFLLYLPYHLSYKIERAISIVPSGRTSLVFYLAIYGLFIYILFRFLLLKFKRYSRVYILFSLFLLSVVSVALKIELLALLILMLILSIISLTKEKNENRAFVYILIITGVLISLFVELFYIQDALGSSAHALIRLNTVFKMYLQNWILWGVAAGAIVFYFRDSLSQKKIWGVMAAMLIIMVSVYPVFATIGKSKESAPTLDGEAYFKKQHPQEYAAVQWFRNISGQPVVLQAPGELYQWNTYITAFTGLPTVLGWAGHELNWRFPARKEIDSRWADVNTMYSSSNAIEVDRLLKKYNVSYIYFGEAETKKYRSPKMFDSHPERFEKAFEYGDVVVYHVKNLN